MPVDPFTLGALGVALVCVALFFLLDL